MNAQSRHYYSGHLPNKNMRFYRYLTLILSVIALIFAFLFFRNEVVRPQNNNFQGWSDENYISNAIGSRVLTDVYAKVNPAVVSIFVYAGNEEISLISLGSGLVYDNRGRIITNAHVVNRADLVDVRFADGVTRKAEIIGIDWYSDLAVLEIDNLPYITPPSLANIDKLSVGQEVVAIGNPFGQNGTMTRGIISAMGRGIPGMTQFRIPTAIQTDAAVNPGNSGGPLLNLAGEVIGINAQLPQDSGRSNSGVGFAIPVSIVRQVIPELIEHGEYIWSWLGIETGRDVDYLLTEAMDLPVEIGAYVAKVSVDSPAALAGLRGADQEIIYQQRTLQIGGDVVTAVDGQPVTSMADLESYVSLHTQPKQRIVLTILRDGEYIDIEIKLGYR